MPRIVKFETWVCKNDRGPRYRGQGHAYDRIGHVIVLKITDEDGFAGIATCLAEKMIEGPMAYLNDAIAPRIIGRDVHEREAIWHDLWKAERHLLFMPLFVAGPVDVALWDLAARRAGLPLYKYLGAARSSIPAYYSSQYMDSVDDYIADVKRCKARGFQAYKVHSEDDLEVFSAVREAAGSEFILMADPGTDWTFEKALRIGRYLEKLNYYWLEEPFRDYHVEKYAKLTAALDIPIAGTEATHGGSWGVAQAIAARAVDIVRADVSWKSGVTGTMKIAHMAEAFGMNCEIHTTVMGPMDIANLHVSCAIRNCEYFELHMPEEMYQFPMKQAYPLDAAGVMHVPQGPGLGIDIDWDAVDNSTRRHLSWSK